MAETLTMFEWQAKLTERAADTLAHWLEMTPEDKAVWCPQLEGSAKTRSALEQVNECIAANRAAAAVFRGEAPTHPEPVMDRTAAANALRESGTELATEIRKLDDAALTRGYPFFNGDMPGAVIMELAVNNMMYHGGAINFIQLLYGDEKFHIPPSFMKG